MKISKHLKHFSPWIISFHKTMQRQAKCEMIFFIMAKLKWKEIFIWKFEKTFDIDIWYFDTLSHCSYLDIYISRKIRLCVVDLEHQFQTTLQVKDINFFYLKIQIYQNYTQPDFSWNVNVQIATVCLWHCLNLTLLNKNKEINIVWGSSKGKCFFHIKRYTNFRFEKWI